MGYLLNSRSCGTFPQTYTFVRWYFANAVRHAAAAPERSNDRLSPPAPGAARAVSSAGMPFLPCGYSGAESRERSRPRAQSRCRGRSSDAAHAVVRRSRPTVQDRCRGLFHDTKPMRADPGLRRLPGRGAHPGRRARPLPEAFFPALQRHGPGRAHSRRGPLPGRRSGPVRPDACPPRRGEDTTRPAKRRRGGKNIKFIIGYFQAVFNKKML